MNVTNMGKLIIHRGAILTTTNYRLGNDKNLQTGKPTRRISLYTRTKK